MATYQPDGWQFILINDSTLKVFGCWWGGYLGCDTWRLNSGCSRILESENRYLVDGYSGSVYILGKGLTRLSSYGEMMLKEIISELESNGHSTKRISVEEAIKFVEDCRDDAK